MSDYNYDGSAKLGYGNMRIPMHEDGTIDYDKTFEMVDKYMESGYGYFDTSIAYGESEALLKTALVERYPRDSFEITTKTNLFMCKSEEDMRNQFKTSLEHLGVDYVDTYFIHALSGHCLKQAYDFKAFDFLRELKRDGLAKHIGFSFHGTVEELDQILTDEPDMELVQLQINYLDWDDEKLRAREQYEVARKHGKLISIMEPCKGGWIATETSDASKILKNANPDVSVASWAMRFCAGLDGVYAILSGMGNVEQVEDNIKTFKNFTPLTEEERELTLKVVETIRAIPLVPCTDCKYCRPACPKDLPIPRLLETYNNLIAYDAEDSSRYIYGMMFADETKRASACVGCKACEQRCPQHIEITKYMGELVRRLEN